MIQLGLLETGRVSSAFIRIYLSRLHMKAGDSHAWGSTAAYREFWGKRPAYLRLQLGGELLLDIEDV
ncbi:polyketide synthase [Penicillium cf. viridicatum]|uniref:Polyketide synthase n=1 Tax=Penicillium cf. viridicatum TaxID=2972119 RepID=A0A9W9J025_9EURO|nr:polyketide synthase [Penicillium cf. viridicatum]